MASITISNDLIMRVREFYTMAYQEISLNESKQIQDNGITDYAIPSYILSVAAVEGFVNEFFLAIGQGFLRDTSFGKLSEEDIKKLQNKKSLDDKLIEIPKLAFDQEVFNKGSQPFQDMKFLIKVRDSFVHYKMAFEPENEGIFDYLVREGIAIKSPKDTNRFWAHDLCTFEGIRWAHNTAIKIIKNIIDTAIKTDRHQILIRMGTQSGNFFHQIPDPFNDRDLWLIWLRSHYSWEKVKKGK